MVATGATHHYFGNDQWEALAPGLKTIENATEIRSRLLLAFERAEREQNPEERRAWLNFVIVGGGPTGVELAGALGEIANDTLRHDFRHINPREAAIMLVEGEPRVLPTFPEDLSAKAERQLIALGVRTRTSARVTQIDASGVTVTMNGREEHIAAHTVLWAAGVRASRLGKVLAERAGAHARSRRTRDGGTGHERPRASRDLRHRRSLHASRIRAANRCPAWRRWRCSRGAMWRG